MNRRHATIAALWCAAVLGVLVVQRACGHVPSTEPEPTRTRVTRGVPVALATEGAPRMLHGDRRHRSRTRLRGPASPVLAWTVTTGAAVVAQPVLDPRGRVIVGSLDRHLYAIDARTGEVSFRVDLGGPIYGAALVLDDGTIIVGSDAQVVYGVAPDGTIRFRVPTAGDADTSPVLAADDTVRVCAGNELYVMTRAGEIRARFRAGGKIFSSPAVLDDGTAVFGAQDDHVYGVDALGHEVFRFRAGGDVDASPAIADDGTILFGSSDGYVYALDVDGRLRWKLAVSAGVRAPMAVVDRRAYVGTLGPSPRMLAINVATGRVAFALELTRSDLRDVGVMSGAVVDADGTVYFGGHDDFLYALDREGRLRWAFATHGDIDGTPAIVGDGAIVFGSEDGVIRMLSRGAPDGGAPAATP